MINRLRSLILKAMGVEAQIQAALDRAARAEAHALRAEEAAARATAYFENRTQVHADISPTRHDVNTIILVGRYRNHDYVQVYNLAPGNFDEVVERFKYEAHRGVIGRVDAPPVFKAVIARDLLAWD